MRKPEFMIFLILVLWQTAGAGKLKFKLACEGGLHRFENQTSEPLFRFSTDIKFNQQFVTQYIGLQGRFTPEIIGWQGHSSSLKFSGKIITGARYEERGWEAYLKAKNYFYQLDTGQDVYFSNADFALSGFQRKTKNSFYTTRFHYIYRDLDTQPANHLDALRAAAGLMFNRWSKASIEISVQIERFRVRTQHLSEKNKGWRSGPELSLSYHSKILIRSALRILYHYSELSRKPGSELQTQLVVGKFLSPRLSLFAYLDYRLSHIPQKELPLELLYSSIDNENWYYLKLEFEAVPLLAIFAKAGYFRDELPENNGSLSGMQGLVGMSWKAP